MSIYLYIKQCSHCSLKYFGRTEKDDPIAYKGSGIYWKNHLKSHNIKEVITLEIFLFKNQSEATAFALMFSEYNDIVNSPHWANQIPENGLHGGTAPGYKQTETHKKNNSIAHIGLKQSKKHKQTREQTVLAKYGAPSYFGSKEFKSLDLRTGCKHKLHSNRDKTIYTFFNTKNQEIFTGERNQFIKKYNATKSQVWYLTTGRKKIYKGWIILY